MKKHGIRVKLHAHSVFFTLKHIYFMKGVKEMYISSTYKEGVVTNKKGHILIKTTFKPSVQDETVYELLKEMAVILADKKLHYRISLIQDNILDKQPDSEKPVPGGSETETTEDIKITVPKNAYLIENIVLSDEAIYGANLDGKNRQYRLIYINSKNEECYVPLEGFDSFKAENPHGKYSYNSETKQLIFSAMYHTDTDYILRRYF